MSRRTVLLCCMFVVMVLAATSCRPAELQVADEMCLAAHYERAEYVKVYSQKRIYCVRETVERERLDWILQEWTGVEEQPLIDVDFDTGWYGWTECGAGDDGTCPLDCDICVPQKEPVAETRSGHVREPHWYYDSILPSLPEDYYDRYYELEWVCKVDCDGWDGRNRSEP